MFIKKSPPLHQMQELGKIHTEILQELKEFIKPGVATIEIEEKFKQLATKFEVVSACLGKKADGSFAYPTNLCVSINEEAIHVYPEPGKVVKEGDLVTVDLVLTKNKVYTDAAFTKLVSGDVDNPVFQQRQKLLQTAYFALEQGIKHAVNGKHTGDIGASIFDIVQHNQYSVLMDYGGHGIGYDMWQEPFVPNFGKKGYGDKLKTGMYIAIEPLISAGSNILEYLDDWKTKTQDNSDFVQVEVTVMIGQNSPILITNIV